MSDTPFFYDEADIIERAIWNDKNQSHRCSIGKIVSVNQNPRSVDVQPLIRYFDKVDKWKDPPILTHVVVGNLNNQNYTFHLPLNPGDLGLLLWADREIYSCLFNGKGNITTPDSGDLDDLNACIFLPIISSFSDQQMFKSAGVEIESSGIKLIEQISKLSQSLDSFTKVLINLGNSIPDPVQLTGASYSKPVGVAAKELETVASQVLNNLVKFKGQQE
jgi:hypothetical protein